VTSSPAGKAYRRPTLGGGRGRGWRPSVRLWWWRPCWERTCGRPHAPPAHPKAAPGGFLRADARPGTPARAPARGSRRAGRGALSPLAPEPGEPPVLPLRVSAVGSVGGNVSRPATEGPTCLQPAHSTGLRRAHIIRSRPNRLPVPSPTSCVRERGGSRRRAPCSDANPCIRWIRRYGANHPPPPCSFTGPLPRDFNSSCSRTNCRRLTKWLFSSSVTAAGLHPQWGVIQRLVPLRKYIPDVPAKTSWAVRALDDVPLCHVFSDGGASPPTPVGIHWLRFGQRAVGSAINVRLSSPPGCPWTRGRGDAAPPAAHA